MGKIRRSVPGGCVVALFGMIAWGYAALCGYGIWILLQAKKTSETPVENFESKLQYFVFAGSIAALFGAALVWIGWRLVMKISGGYDPRDPDEPSMRF